MSALRSERLAKGWPQRGARRHNKLTPAAEAEPGRLCARAQLGHVVDSYTEESNRSIQRGEHRGRGEERQK